MDVWSAIDSSQIPFIPHPTVLERENQVQLKWVEKLSSVYTFHLREDKAVIGAQFYSCPFFLSDEIECHVQYLLKERGGYMG